MKIIFVTGAPGAGKTFISDYIVETMGKKEKVIQMGVDFIRDILRANINKDDNQELHASSLFQASEAHYRSQATTVIDKGIVPAVLRGIEERRNMIFDGVNCVPSMLQEAFADIETNVAKIVYIVITVPNVKNHLKQLELQNDVDVEAKMGKIEKIRHMQDFLIADGESAGAHVLHNDDTIFERLKKIISEL